MPRNRQPAIRPSPAPRERVASDSEPGEGLSGKRPSPSRPSAEEGAMDIVDCMTAMRGDHQPFAVATVVRTEDATAAKAGARAVIRADGSVVGWIGGGCALAAVRTAAAHALLAGKARVIRVRPAPPPRTVRLPS